MKSEQKTILLPSNAKIVGSGIYFKNPFQNISMMDIIQNGVLIYRMYLNLTYTMLVLHSDILIEYLKNNYTVSIKDIKTQETITYDVVY
jgi:hypothetical protein